LAGAGFVAGAGGAAWGCGLRRLRLGLRRDCRDLHFQIVDAALLRSNLLRLGGELTSKLRELWIFAHGRSRARASERNENDDEPQTSLRGRGRMPRAPVS